MSMPLAAQKYPAPLLQRNRRRAMTLVEAMVSMLLMAMFMLGFLDTFMQSRRLTEGSVMQSAATTLVYGLVEQIKMMEYKNTPLTAIDANQSTDDAFPGPSTKSAPYVRVRISQDQVTWLQCTDSGVVPAPAFAPANLVGLPAASKNTIGPLTPSTTGAKSQPLTLDLWVWVDPFTGPGILDAKSVTIVYAYVLNDGREKKTYINREVFLRMPFKQLNPTS